MTKKIIIITSCTGEKRHTPTDILTHEDFQLAKSELKKRERALDAYRLPAGDMYTGQQHLHIMRGIKAIRQTSDYSVDLQIISAGYGLIPENESIVPYESTFKGMRKNAILTWSSQLKIPEQVRQLFTQSADYVVVALGKDYLTALQLTQDTEFCAPTLFLCAAESIRTIPKHDNVRAIGLTNQHARRFHSGSVGLKGDLVQRILHHVQQEGEAFWETVFDSDPEQLFTRLDELTPERRSAKKVIPRLDRVDHVVRIPESWFAASKAKSLRFFLPDWDDHVDPDYDFATDTHRGVRGSWENQMYAHQLFQDEGESMPTYDGLLVSRAVIEGSKKKAMRIKELGGIHRYLRVPNSFEVLGDCGAFSYLLHETPPYTTDEILDYYSTMGVNYGVSIDHLLFGATTDAGKQQRYDLTIENARAFIKEHNKRGLRWIPIGALQGQTPEAYAEAAKLYVKLGYKYLAIGGQVRSKTPLILEIANAIRREIPSEVKLHLFGVARLDSLNQFRKAGINTVDSASYLRQAWMRMGQNYLGHDGLYSAIRIPDVEKRIKVMESPLSVVELWRRMEYEVLKAIHDYGRGQRQDVQNVLELILEYKNMVGVPTSLRIQSEYRVTLENRPWTKCDCAICKNVGIDVVIFRGNNRNRRRGFHNNQIFYRHLERTLQEGQPTYPWHNASAAVQELLPFIFTSADIDV